MLSPEASFPGHELSGGVVIFSFHRKWMASAAPDGKLLTRLVESPVSTFTCTGNCLKVIVSAVSVSTASWSRGMILA